MPAMTLERMHQDDLAVSVALAVAAANDMAATYGVDPASSLVTISEDATDSSMVWRVEYGARDVSRRGGDLIVLIDKSTGEVTRVLHGQ